MTRLPKEPETWLVTLQVDCFEPEMGTVAFLPEADAGVKFKAVAKVEARPETQAGAGVEVAGAGADLAGAGAADLAGTGGAEDLAGAAAVTADLARSAGAAVITA